MKKKLTLVHPNLRCRRKLWILRTMKLLLVLMVLILSQQNLLSQNPKLFTKNYVNASVQTILMELQNESGYRFVFMSDDVKSLKKVTKDFKNATVEEILDYCLRDSGLAYEKNENAFVIFPQKKDKKDAVAKDKKTIMISGKVLDEKEKLPLPGATVLIVGINEGITTDMDGKFILSVPSEDAVLRISFVGFENQLLTVGTQREFTIFLKEATTQLGEVVVTGVFTRKANTYTGAVKTVDGEELQKISNANIVASLKTIDPSFMVVDNLATGSDPNSLPTIQMRGQTGFTDITSNQSNPNQPLFILDGFETTLTKILELDMNLVQSVTLLKDATAKAMYGSKAGNGVVVVETKRPTEGKMRVTYNGSLNIEVPDLTSYNLTDAWEKVEAEKKAGLYTASNGSAISQIALDNTYSALMQQINMGVNTDWLVQPLRVGVGQKHALSFEGGDNVLLYRADISYNKIVGTMIGSDRSTLSGTLSLTYRYKNFQFRNQLSIDNNTSNDSPYGSFSAFALMNPYQAIYDENGNMFQYCTNGTVSQVNPLWNGTINTIDQSKYASVTENFYAEWKIRPLLKVTSRLGVTKTISSSDDFKPASHTDFYSYTDDNLYKAGKYIKSNGETNSFSLDLGVDWSFQKDKHVFFTNFMASVNESSFENAIAIAQGFASEDLHHFSSAVEYFGTKPDGSERISRTFGAIGSLNYSYDSRYLFDANYRLSGSSEFGANKRWGSFWSLGAGWNLHKEKFMSGITWLDLLKLRGSVGFTGTQGFSTYDALATLQYYSSSQYEGKIGSYLVGLANPDLQWQKRYDSNIGIDFTLFNGIVTGRFDLYEATTKGLITTITTPQSMGFSSYVANLGESKNTGFEAYFSVRVFNDPETNSYFNVFGSVASNKNKLVKISNSLKAKNDDIDNEMDSDNTVTSVAVRYDEGASLNAIWAVPSLGIDPETGREIYIKKDGSLSYTWSSTDQVVCGDNLPDISGNFGFTGEYHGLGLNATFTWQYGGQLYNTTLLNKVENADPRYNVDERVLTNRWNEPGDNVQFKSVADDSYTQPTSRFVQDNNIFRLSSLNIYYDFRNTKIVQDTFLKRCKLAFYMNNVFTLSSIKIERGTDYPFARTFTFSLLASF